MLPWFLHVYNGNNPSKCTDGGALKINPGDSLCISSFWVCYKNIIYGLYEMIAPRPPLQSKHSTYVVAPFIFNWAEVARSNSWKGEKSPLPSPISRVTYWEQNVWDLLLLALVRDASSSWALSLFPEDFLLLCLEISEQTWACHVS